MQTPPVKREAFFDAGFMPEGGGKNVSKPVKKGSII